MSSKLRTTSIKEPSNVSFHKEVPTVCKECCGVVGGWDGFCLLFE